jgi:hypothetical protein
MDATPLTNPTTETGVNRFVLVPSPSCREGHNVVSNKRLLSKNRQTLHSTDEKTTTGTITCPLPLPPQHFTPPSLVTAHEYRCITHVRSPRPLPHHHTARISHKNTRTGPPSASALIIRTLTTNISTNTKASAIRSTYKSSQHHLCRKQATHHKCVPHAFNVHRQQRWT